MIDYLQEVLPRLAQLPPQAQEEVANYIELLERKALMEEQAAYFESEELWIDLAGAWSDLPDDMCDELDKLRHSNPPTLTYIR
jgi:hypothetical protein